MRVPLVYYNIKYASVNKIPCLCWWPTPGPSPGRSQSLHPRYWPPRIFCSTASSLSPRPCQYHGNIWISVVAPPIGLWLASWLTTGVYNKRIAQLCVQLLQAGTPVCITRGSQVFVTLYTYDIYTHHSSSASLFVHSLFTPYWTAKIVRVLPKLPKTLSQ